MYVANTLAPVFLIIILGAVLQKTSFLSARLTREMNRLVYWVGLPCLLFDKTAKTSIAGGSALRVCLVLVATTAACKGSVYFRR